MSILYIESAISQTGYTNKSSILTQRSDLLYV